MEERFINRYNSFCRSVDNLQKSTVADVSEPFVLEGTVQIYNLTFDLSWKVMKDVLVKYLGILDFATGSPRETLQTAFQNNLIDNDIWMEMLKTRNLLAHDYDGFHAKDAFDRIVNCYYAEFVKFKDAAKKYYE